MKHISFIFVAVAFTLAFVSCEKNESVDPVDNPRKSINLNTRSAELIRQGNNFAFNFFDKVNEVTEEDFIISPLSMQFLLGMILDGAKGQTADEICNVLGYGAGEVDAVNEFSQSVLSQIPNLDKTTKLAIANAVVVNKSYPLIDSYKSTVSKYYFADVSNLDFSKSSTVTKINKWCSDHTKGLIPEVIKSVSPNSIAYLLNAGYCKGQWKTKFPKGKTSSASFTAEDGSKKTVQMMRNNKHFLYQDNDLLRAVSLPYGNGAFSMMVILPAEGKTLSDVVKGLNGESWAEFVASMVDCDVDLWLPKFDGKFHIDLNTILKALGMPSAFNSSVADFTAMSSKGMYISSVIQDAIIKVDEGGTTAAAVSVAKGDMMASPGDRVVFHADHPFLYLITETGTGTVLFAGKFAGNN